MRQYLIDTFIFNDKMNKLVLKKILLMPQPEESVKLFSHLINSQNKWMARVRNDPGAHKKSWFEPYYKPDELEQNWNKSFSSWIDFLSSISDQDIYKEVKFIGDNDANFGALVKDIAIQLDNHSIHHRAQICTLLRRQDIEPPFVEYIGTVRKQY